MQTNTRHVRVNTSLAQVNRSYRPACRFGLTKTGQTKRKSISSLQVTLSSLIKRIRYKTLIYKANNAKFVDLPTNGIDVFHAFIYLHKLLYCFICTYIW